MRKFKRDIKLIIFVSSFITIVILYSTIWILSQPAEKFEEILTFFNITIDKDEIDYSSYLGKLIVVGDSRTVNMSQWVEQKVNTTFIAENGKGYKWFVNKAIPQVNKVKEAGDSIVIWLGVNDYFKTDNDYWQKYADIYNSLVNTTWRDCYVYVASVGYVDRNKIISYYNKDNRSNIESIDGYANISGIREFNQLLKENLNDNIQWIDISDVIGIDANDNVTKNNIWFKHGDGRLDGLHYGKDISQKVYNRFIKETIFPIIREE